MAYYNFNPDIADQLGLPSLSHQRRFDNNRVCGPGWNGGADDGQFKGDHLSQYPRYQRPELPSSTSLFLQKTRERETVQRVTEYSYENLTHSNNNLNIIPPKPHRTRHRPLIKVTVIPTNTATQTKLRKRRHCSKKLQTTHSNQESCIKAKNVYLVVAGKKREKIYEIKTTGSAELSSNHLHYVQNEEIAVEQNFQQLLSSLNMDKKKKKGKKDKGKKDDDQQNKDDDVLSKSSLMNVIEDSGSPIVSSLRECVCPPLESMSTRKSRVRITGKIGLTEDDRYVMKCNATIDGKPVETNFATEQRYSPKSKDWEGQEQRGALRKNHENQEEKIKEERIPCPRAMREMHVSLNQKEAYVQANLLYEDPYRPRYNIPCPAFRATCPAFRSVETQCTHSPYNAVYFSNIDQLRIFTTNRDEIVQCDCGPENITNTNNMGIGTEYDQEAISPKSCNSPIGNNSPLVIISVYPKQGSSEKINGDQSPIKESVSKPAPKGNVKKKSGDGKKKQESTSKNDDKIARSGSPTSYKAKPEKLTLKGKKDIGKPDIPEKQTTKGNKKKGKKEKGAKEAKDKFSKLPSDNLNFSPEQSVQSGQMSPSNNVRCTECCLGCVGKKNKMRSSNNVRCTECCVGCVSNKNRTDVSGQKCNSKRMMNWVSAKSDVSNVAINIDGENEFYDVLFRQGDITTDLRVRKTFKDDTQGRKHVKEAGNDSLENFFLEPEEQEPKRRSFSQTFNLNDQPIADIDVTWDQTIPRLNVRDSIEISHRREEKDSGNSVTPDNTASSSASSSNSKNRIFFAPVKHFQGDSCDLTNPIARDKEIRELLGIEKRPTTSKTSQEPHMKMAASDGSLHCFYQRNRNKMTTSKLDAIHNIYKLEQLPSCLCFEDDADLMDEVVSEEIHFIDGTGDSIICDDVDETCVICTDNPSEFADWSEREAKQSKKIQCQICSQLHSNIMVTSPRGSDISLLSNCSLKNSVITECMQTHLPTETLYQQLILNRNINVYLQIEQFTKQKPIILSRQQYEKVKRTIENATSRRFNCIFKRSSVCIGEVRKTLSPQCCEALNKGVQCECSESFETKKSPTRLEITINSKMLKNDHCNNNTNFDNCNQPCRNSLETKVSQECCDILSKKSDLKLCCADQKQETVCTMDNKEYCCRKVQCKEDFTKSECCTAGNKNVNTCFSEEASKAIRLETGKRRKRKTNKVKTKLILKNDSDKHHFSIDIDKSGMCQRCGQDVNTHLCNNCGRLTKGCNSKPCYFCQVHVNDVESKDSVKKGRVKKVDNGSRHAASSTEVRYARVTYTKRVKFSTTNIVNKAMIPSVANLLQKNYNSNSLRTIFKGHRKPPSPNLGTSAYSLYSEFSDTSSKNRDVQDTKLRKPFLKRLMSCLVMRSKTSYLKFRRPIPKFPSANSTIDSYHINTSLGGIELTSSIFDTSASFFSNHSIHPISSKIKRGFLSSVRGFLTNRRT